MPIHKLLCKRHYTLRRQVLRLNKEKHKKEVVLGVAVVAVDSVLLLRASERTLLVWGTRSELVLSTSLVPG